MIDYLEKISLSSESPFKIGKYVSIKPLIFSKMGLHDVTNLVESVVKTLLRGFCALSPEIWKNF